VLEELKLWKILTFPFAIHTLDSFLLFAFAFNFFSVKLEKLVGSFRYPFWLLILNLILGCLITLVFWNSQFSFSGIDGISIFAISLYLMLKPRSTFNIFKGKINLLPMTLLFLIFWISSKIFVYGFNDATMAITTITSSIFGIATSLLIYFQIKIYNRNEVEPATETHPRNFPDIEMLSAIREKKTAGFLYNTEKMKYDNIDELIDENTYYNLTDDPAINEDHLNYILDKINETGRDSLTHAERKFLYDYSKQI